MAENNKEVLQATGLSSVAIKLHSPTSDDIAKLKPEVDEMARKAFVDTREAMQRFKSSMESASAEY